MRSELAVTPTVTSMHFASHTSPTSGISLPSRAHSPSSDGPSLLGGDSHAVSVCLELIVPDNLCKPQNSPSRSGDPLEQTPAKATTVSTAHHGP